MIVDSHTHVLPEEFRAEKDRYLERDLTFRALFSSKRAMSVPAEKLLAEMESSGVDRSVIAGYGWTDLTTARLANDYILEAARASDSRLIPLCSVNPIWGSEAVEEIERCHELGARGIGELHPNSQNFLDADFTSLAPVFSMSRRLDLPVLVHTSEPVGHAYPGKGTVTPEYSLALAEAFPQNTFVFAHFGGGLPFYSLMPEVRRSLRNVYFDSAASPLLYSPDVFKTVAGAAGHDRLLFASDYPLVGQARALEEFELHSPSEVERSAVLGQNACNVWSIS